MSKLQVERDYLKLLLEREGKINADQPRSIWQLVTRGQRYYPMPLMPLDEDFRSIKDASQGPEAAQERE